MRLLYADAAGNFYDHPALRPVGRTGDIFVELNRGDFIELPPGSSLVLIPGGRPVGAGGRPARARRAGGERPRRRGRGGGARGRAGP
ncbi:MAG: hypothetical protein K6T65_15795, partial [Peptococcaceae bacterium]|nr:hypothetical protein [Peptococcaceae bacterium]